jgi:uncharacterized RDD family membrane protein YckC
VFRPRYAPGVPPAGAVRSCVPSRASEPSPPRSGGGSTPSTGAGAVAGFGARLLAFLVDSLLANAVAVIADGGFHAGGRHNLTVFAAFLAIEVVFIATVAQTPGMRVAGIAVVRMADHARVPLRWVAVRTVLLAFVLPALIVDASGRAMHDRAAGTVMIRTR